MANQLMPRTICHAIAEQATHAPDRPAIACAELPDFSYRELDLKIKQIGGALHAAGIGASSRVGVMLPPGPEAAVAAIAVCGHAISFPLNPLITAEAFTFELRRAALDAVVCPDWLDLPALAVCNSSGTAILRTSKALHSLNDISVEADTEPPTVSRRSDVPSSRSVAVIQTSSGSTGIPKLILVTHANLFDIAHKMRMWFGLSSTDRGACLLPVHSGFGFKIALVAPLLLGSTVVIAKTAEAEAVATWISDRDPTWFVSTPTYLNAALDKLRSTVRGTLAHSLRFFASTSAYLPEPVRTELEAILGVPALEFYGLREAGMVAGNPAPPAIRKPGSVGLATPDVAILDQEDTVLPCGETGAVAVRGQGVSPGYVEALPPDSDIVPDADTTQGKWTLTGDLGVVDADGFLTIVGRSKEIINRGGEKISPYEVEKALLQHPAISEAGAFGVPHPRLGEIVAAAVVLKPGHTARPIELRDYLGENLDWFKIPRRIVILNSLPKGPTGKIARRELVEFLEGELERQARVAPHAVDDGALDGRLVFGLTEIWQRLLKTAPIGLDDDFFEKGGDSLLAIQMHAELERLTDRTIPGTILFEATTIRQLVQAISAGRTVQEKPLVKLHTNGSRTPLFFFHSEFNGVGYSAIILARLLGTEQPLFAIDPHGLGEEPVPQSITAMAADRLPLILQAQPHGPYRLFGSCVGGLVAFEAARLLIDAGHEVEMVIMADPPTISARKSVQWLLSTMRLTRPIAAPLVDRVMAWTFQRLAEVDKFSNISWARRWAALKKRAGIAARNGSDSDEVSHSKLLTVAERDAIYEVAMAHYNPAPLPVHVIYFSIDHRGEAWRRMATDFEIVKSGGNHFEPDLEDIARNLRTYLQTAVH